LKRAFFSLYFLIVVALLAVGWGLDRLWEAHQPADGSGETLARVVARIAAQDPNLNQTRQLLQTLNSAGLVHLTLLPETQLTGDALLTRLQDGAPLTLSDGRDRQYLYQRLPGHPYLLVVEQYQPAPGLPWLRPALILVFYAAIALVIFFWLWPLSRDLARLEQHAQALGLDNRYDQVDLPAHATAYRLGEAFNRMAERIRELVTTQREMTHAVSHELRTPLARMKFALEMADRDENSPIKAQLSGLRADVAEMDELVNQLLNYARLEQSQPTLTLKPGDMRAMAEEIARRLLTGENAKQVRILPDEPVADFVCDWPLMERALLNLIQNALRYCSHDVVVTLEITEDRYRILVDDDGPGIPPEERERIFHSFTRLRQAPENAGAGFGLGLAIVRRVIHWHRGTARVEASPLGGARLLLEWPKPAPHSLS
jgi:two-component system, OmpR family, sensor kinase